MYRGKAVVDNTALVCQKPYSKISWYQPIQYWYNGCHANRDHYYRAKYIKAFFKVTPSRVVAELIGEFASSPLVPIAHNLGNYEIFN